jgi:hypothetical protein
MAEAARSEAAGSAGVGLGRRYAFRGRSEAARAGAKESGRAKALLDAGALMRQESLLAGTDALPWGTVEISEHRGK